MAPRVRNRTECGLECDRSGDEDLIQRSEPQGSIDGGVAVSWANLLRMLRPASFGEGSHVITCHMRLRLKVAAVEINCDPVPVP
jgi:hypothetical protein